MTVKSCAPTCARNSTENCADSREKFAVQDRIKFVCTHPPNGLGKIVKQVRERIIANCLHIFLLHHAKQVEQLSVACEKHHVNLCVWESILQSSEHWLCKNQTSHFAQQDHENALGSDRFGTAKNQSNAIMPDRQRSTCGNANPTINHSLKSNIHTCICGFDPQADVIV